MNTLRTLAARDFAGHPARHEVYAFLVSSGDLISQERSRPSRRFFTGTFVEDVCAIRRGTRRHFSLAKLDIAGVAMAAAIAQTPY